jgi:hypothetical protein
MCHFDQGWEVVRAEQLQQMWKEKYDEWLKRPKSKRQLVPSLKKEYLDSSLPKPYAVEFPSLP